MLDDKIIEKLMHKLLMAFLNDQNIYYKNNWISSKIFYCTQQLISLIVFKKQWITTSLSVEFLLIYKNDLIP